MSENDQSNSQPPERELLLGRCDFLVESHLWPLERNLNYRGWLENFTPAEVPFAERLLTNFMYYSNEVTKHLFRFAFNSLVSSICDFREPGDVCNEQWREFLKSVVVTHVTGEDPSPTDSGYHFSRLTRQVLGIESNQILTNQEAVEKLYFGDCSTVVFVDDFVGSGNQFCETWDRTWTVAPNLHYSFKRIAAEGNRPFNAFYCPVFCTWKGKSKIAIQAPHVQVRAAHVLDQSYSALTSQSRFWPPDLSPHASSFIQNVSARAGVEGNWDGFNGLGLGIAFEHGIPDATLPIYYHESATWLPLMRRS